LAFEKIRSLLKNLLLSAAVFVVSVELLSFAAIETKMIPADAPSYEWPTFVPFWDQLDKKFSNWHSPNARYVHVNSCYNVTYRSNQHGMRDRDRTVTATGKRVVFLGDSFAEGYGLARADRLSDRLETMTSVPHLNFGVSGNFGPTQYLLLYRTLAKKFDHSGILVQLLPDNDFTDDDPAFWRRNPRDWYRPLFFKRNGGFELDYIDKKKIQEADGWNRREFVKGLRTIHRNYSYTSNLIAYFQVLFEDQNTAGRTGSYSGYYDFTDEQAARFEFVIGELTEAAGEKTILFVVTPRASDIERFRKVGPPSRFNALIDRLKAKHGTIRFLDLLPRFVARSDIDAFYNDCDGHWTPEGAAAASEIIHQHADYESFQ
jgi:hypothetical protein